MALLLPMLCGRNAKCDHLMHTDFYASREHATNYGTIQRGPNNALQPNW